MAFAFLEPTLELAMKVKCPYIYAKSRYARGRTELDQPLVRMPQAPWRPFPSYATVRVLQKL